jgi:tRNA (guanine-N7-)-methyltransferase
VSRGSGLWRRVFGTARPVEIEIGPGRGDVLLAFARARPDTNFFAVEHAAGAAEAIAAAAARHRLGNVRVVAGDARCIVERLVPPASVTAIHVYFPDPWPKTRHRHRRLFDGPDFARAIARALAPGGAVHVASDLPDLFRAMWNRFTAAGLTPRGTAPPPRPVSKFERKYARAGAHAASFIKLATARRRDRVSPGPAPRARRTPRSR